ncbi:gliding motility protein [Flavobacterium succinicans]|uniref:type IX secretion system periplasmic lipoprotein PorW/SprE n=1 Tax=Flavobacterium succinicans TaxID=29536 RepID=UPI002936FE16|nr:gliding motility protein [Flavobacterium succinicans]
MSRNSHALSTRYNILYNGQIGLDKGLNGLVTGDKDNFWELLPIERMQFSGSLPSDDKTKNADFELAETKATKAIQKHSMNIGGREVNYQMDEAYLLLGKARYYDQRFVPALDAFNYILYKYPESDKIYEAKVWREKTNMRLGNDALVVKNINKLLKDEEFKDQPFADANALLAEAFLNLEKKDSAVAKLKIAVDFTKRNEEKARYRFILGQLYQELGKRDSALFCYDAVIDMNRSAKREYIIQSYARKAQLFDYKTGNPDAFVAIYNELIKDRENRPFLDVIYHNMGLFYDHYNKPDSATIFYKISLKEKPKDLYLAASNYRNIGNIYFKATNYPLAAKYYDSTLVKLNPKAREFYKIQKKRKDLDEVILLENSTKRNDSILKVVALSPSERNAYYEKHIVALKKQDSIKQVLEEIQKQKLANIERNLSASDPAAMPTGPGLANKKAFLPPTDNSQAESANTFYFYNPKTVAFGKLEFRKAYGNRALVENWLFSNVKKGANEISNDTINDDSAAIEKAVEDPRYTIPFYLKQLPTQSSAIDSITKERNKGYYQLGLVYKEKFKEYDLASAKLEQLLSFQPDVKLIPPILYNLYKIYEITNKAKAASVKEDISSKFPDSRYAKIINDPTFDGSKDKDSPENKYKECYEWFKDEKFAAVIARCNMMINQLTGEEIVAKFELLKANALAKTKGLPAYKEAMQYVADTYANTEEGKKAEEIITTQIPILERMAFSTIDTKKWKIIFRIPIEDYKQERAIEKQVLEFMAKENIENLYYTCDNYTDSERILCIHGFRSEVYANDVSVIFSKKGLPAVKQTAIPITDENYKIVQMKKNLDAYLNIKTP